MKGLHIGALCLLGCSILAGGCSIADNRTPEELLSLAAAGLSGKDRYVFEGKSAFIDGGGVQKGAVSFQGSVTGHSRLKMETYSEEGGKTGDAGDMQMDPSGLLRRLREAKKTVTVDPARSDENITVLHIELDPEQSTREWKRRMQSEWASVASRKAQNEKMYAGLSGPLKRKFIQEWNRELNLSGRELERMLDSLHVMSACELTIDRTRLLPLQIAETSTLDYESAGMRRKEGKTTDIRFVSFDGIEAQTVHAARKRDTMFR
ncbi:hypothetical protein [Paenibacillus beijingensis]|uniref:Lipoprotein n=1 Tax=Paenibacillus beijingensis TaxID=1126833 RepID=A0A0D5NNC9_9BACL|nr:hypothetical protein [Paenibacillus beijingensis]AJY76433.1 hypothetical protein VN24_19985 [Paenibacillus beijingensis]